LPATFILIAIGIVLNAKSMFFIIQPITNIFV
jgi:hypothetical protein